MALSLLKLKGVFGPCTFPILRVWWRTHGAEHRSSSGPVANTRRESSRLFGSGGEHLAPTIAIWAPPILIAIGSNTNRNCELLYDHLYTQNAHACCWDDEESEEEAEEKEAEEAEEEEEEEEAMQQDRI